MIKTKEFFIAIALLLFCSITSTLFSQTTENSKNIDSLEMRVQLYRDTLNFEYDGPIQEHQKIIQRVITSLNNTFLALNYSDLRSETDSYKHYPLITSFEKRIRSLAENYLKKNSKIVTPKNNYSKYILNGGFNSYWDILIKPGDQIADKYIEVILRFCSPSLFQDRTGFQAFNDLKDKNFANLVAEATQKGIKQTATNNGFYNKNLAMKISKAVLFNRIEKLMKSNKKFAYKVVYIADSYIAICKVADEEEDPMQNTTQQEKVLKKILNKYNGN